MVLAVVTLVATSSAFAQDANVNASARVDFDGPNGGMMGRPGQGGMGRPPQGGPNGGPQGEGEGQGRMGMRGWMRGSTTMPMMASTTWKEFKGDMKQMREDMKGRMASLTDAQVSAIALKLGITVDALKAKLATGTPLRLIIGNKISREDMMKIMPMPMMGSGTMATGSMPMMRNQNREPQGFFNSMRERFFGPRQRQGDDGNMEVSGDVNANVEVSTGLGGFFKRLFNF